MLIPKNAIKVFSGELYEAYQWNLQISDGTHRIYEGLKGKDLAQIILIFDDGEIGIGIEQETGQPPVFGLLGGIIRNYEDALMVVKRELLEGTGFMCEEIISYKESYSTEGILRGFHYFIGRGIKYIKKASEISGNKIEIIKVSVEELMQIISGPYFKDEDFAFDILKEYYNGGVSRIRAVLGLWEGIKEEEIKLDIIEKIIEIKKPIKKVAKKKVVSKIKKKVIKKPKIEKDKSNIKLKKVIKPKKLIKKKKIISKINVAKKKVDKKESFVNFLDKLDKKIKKKGEEFEEPLF